MLVRSVWSSRREIKRLSTAEQEEMSPKQEPASGLTPREESRHLNTVMSACACHSFVLRFENLQSSCGLSKRKSLITGTF